MSALFWGVFPPEKAAQTKDTAKDTGKGQGPRGVAVVPGAFARHRGKGGQKGNGRYCSKFPKTIRLRLENWICSLIPFFFNPARTIRRRREARSPENTSTSM